MPAPEEALPKKRRENCRHRKLSAPLIMHVSKRRESFIQKSSEHVIKDASLAKKVLIWRLPRFCHWEIWGHYFGSEKGHLLTSLHTQGDEEHFSRQTILFHPIKRLEGFFKFNALMHLEQAAFEF
ncbi:hypothetical protein CDAR_99261 [Caerostris darwini]|uniref:Uncharacterized protein n=1 Tax=Caerostris darwini TaxID=1538125 RepID=A0AAV4Q5J6_9ARAC|nr:hypothetical protein CDAR_99261 [Caerostris darwini]